MNTETFQITEYNETAAALAVLREKYGTVFDVKTPKGMTAAREARAEVRGYRVALEKLRVEIKAPALERTRLIDAEAKRITAALLAIEEPIDAAIKAEETRKAEEKAAQERAEAARVAAIQARIAAIRNQIIGIAHASAESISAELAAVEALELKTEDFEEFLTDAQAAQGEALIVLNTALKARMAHEEDQARIKAEREELARLRAQDEARRAEQARVETEAKAKADAEAAEIRKAQEAEAERIRQENERIATAQHELNARQRRIEEAERKAREDEERKAREVEARAEAEAKAKVKARKKKPADPLEELAQAVSAGLPIGSALKMAYDIGYEAGMKAAQRAA